jgi:hypothetical protein
MTSEARLRPSSVLASLAVSLARAPRGRAGLTGEHITRLSAILPVKPARCPLSAITTLVLSTLLAACSAESGGGQTPASAPPQALSQPAETPARQAPRTSDGKADFSGIWNADRKFIYDINDALKPGETLPLQPWALKVTLERMSKDDPEARCLPTGVPRQAPYPWRIVQTATHMFFLFEGNIHSFRQIFLDGRPHPPDLDPTWYGHSIGRFEGDTLVIDTIGFNDKFWFDFAGHPHTEQLHTIERFRRPNFDTLEYEVTIDDPGAFTRAFTLYGSHTYADDMELMEYICNENNQDVEHIVGRDPRNKYVREGLVKGS